MFSNFDFLENEFPDLADLGRKAELYRVFDPQASVAKLGYMGEAMINRMLRDPYMRPPAKADAREKIEYLYSLDQLSYGQKTMFHELRKKRNIALHPDGTKTPPRVITQDDCDALLPVAHALCEWFAEAYSPGVLKYEHRDFVMPAAQMPVFAAPETHQEQEREKKKEKELAAKSDAIADAAPKATREERKERLAAASKKFLNEMTEADARVIIDEQLRQVGWEADTVDLRYAKGSAPAKGKNRAIAEWPTRSAGKDGFADYALFIGEKLVGFIEAKAPKIAISSIIDNQCKEYAAGVKKNDLKYTVGQWGEYRVPFVFAANGRPYSRQLETSSGIWSLDLRDGTNTPRALRGWYSPENITHMLDAPGGAAERLKALPYEPLTDKSGLALRPYQIEAIQAAEKAIEGGAHSALIAMATGTGKTRTVLGLIYRFLKTDRYRRILFIVDRNALGEQAQSVFAGVKLVQGLSLGDIYNITRLGDYETDASTRVRVATVQSMVARVLEPGYGGTMPAAGDYDLIIIDEAHRGYILDKEMSDAEQLYRDQADFQSRYRAVLDYFDADRIALTATPALHTVSIFGNPVYWYTYEQAVIDGYLADFDAPHEIRTKLSEDGIVFRPGETVTYINTQTGQTHTEVLPDEIAFGIEDFNRNVITESFNRTVLEAIADDIDPEKDAGKTLIFAVDNDHADLIVRLLRDIYAKKGGRHQDAIAKITAAIGDRQTVQKKIDSFKNEFYPKIAVTVDLLTTGIDVPAINKLVFLRRVGSRILFEQMIGRATRLCPEIHKTHFEIYDAVGQCKLMEQASDMKPSVVSSNAALEELARDISGISADTPDFEKILDDAIPAIAAKLRRKTERLSDARRAEYKETTGETPEDTLKRLHTMPKLEAARWLEENISALKLLDKTETDGREVIISKETDELRASTRRFERGGSARGYLEEFRAYLAQNRNTIAALEIVCTRPGDLTRAGLEELQKKLRQAEFTEKRLNTAVNETRNTADIAADLITLVRAFAIGSPLLSHDERVRGAMVRLREGRTFTPEQSRWLDSIEKYVLRESVLNVDVFDTDDRFRYGGSFAGLNKLFDGQLAQLVRELNANLYGTA